MNSKAKQRHARGLFGPVDGPQPAAPVTPASSPAPAPMSAGRREHAVGDDARGLRLDKFLAERFAAAGEALSRTRLQGLIEAGLVAVDGARADDAGQKMRAGQTVVVDVPEAEPAEPQGENIPLNILFEDRHLIVIDKPAGLVVHPAAGHANGTLVNALIAHCGASLSGVGGVRRPGIVHRLDKDTSGLLVVAKSDAAHQGLAELFADHGRTLNLVREYLALVWGAPARAQGSVDAPIGRHPHQRERQAIVHGERGRRAVTHWRVEETLGGQAKTAALLRCALETGRTHQIRVHMAHIGHPVLADPVYAAGYKTKAAKLPEKARKAHDAMKRQALHAATLGFTHPVTGEELLFESKPPADMIRLLRALR